MLKFGTRHYTPSLVRWTQTDPKAGDPPSPLTMNPDPDLFAGADPTNEADSDGRSFTDVLGGAIFGAVGGLSGVIGVPVISDGLGGFAEGVAAEDLGATLLGGFGVASGARCSLSLELG